MGPSRTAWKRLTCLRIYRPRGAGEFDLAVLEVKSDCANDADRWRHRRHDNPPGARLSANLAPDSSSPNKNFTPPTTRVCSRRSTRSWPARGARVTAPASTSRVSDRRARPPHKSALGVRRGGRFATASNFNSSRCSMTCMPSRAQSRTSCRKKWSSSTLERSSNIQRLPS